MVHVRLSMRAKRLAKPGMNLADLARLLQLDGSTLRRWTALYAEFLSPGAAPPKGKARALADHDLKVLRYIATMRDSGQDQIAIADRLKAMQADGWHDLPGLPAEWGGVGKSVPMDLAASRASEMAQVAVLQSELQHARMALEASQNRVKELEVLVQENHALQLDLERARADVRALEARLEGYQALLGDRPRNLVLIVLAALVLGAILVALAFTLSRVLM